MQFRPDGGNSRGVAMQKPDPTPPLPGAPPLRGGFPVDYGPRADDRRQPLASPLSKIPAHNNNKAEDQEEAPPSRHLWVGNMSQDVSDEVLMEKFVKFGEVYSVTVYSSRNYAFVNFRNQEDAVEAKKRLQGVNLCGLAMRIEFAKGRMCKYSQARARGTDFAYTESSEEAAVVRVKQSRHLWIGGIGQSTLREQIEAEFRRFGVIENFKILRDRNCGFIDFTRLEDAVAAVEALDHKCIGDEELRVDYGWSQSVKRDLRGDERGSTQREHWGAPDDFPGPYDSSQGGAPLMGSGEIRGKVDKDGGPSEVLWVGFPLLSEVDEERLLRAFMPFGEIERVKTFPGRTYAFVQFRSVEDATRAKDNLEGKLFGDPRVHIRFSKSEIGAIDNSRDIPRNNGGLILPSARWLGDGQGYTADNAGAALGPRGHPSPGGERFGSPARPSNSTTMRMSGLRPEYRPDGLMAGLGLTAPRCSTRNSESEPEMGWGSGRGDGRLDAIDYARGMPGCRSDSRSSFDDVWDLPDEDILPRDPKRMRVYPGGEAKTPRFDVIYGLGHRGGDFYTGTGGLDGLGTTRGPINADYNQGKGPRYHGGVSVISPYLSPDSALPSTVSQVPAPNLGPANPGYAKRDGFSGDSGATAKWHGIIAKGGTPVCRACCLPVSKGIDVTIPDVVNCTARTDLDMLAKHVFQAGDFGVVFFVPEGDADVPPYQEFMNYLGEKHRAGVAKLADGTTLFLVPPSEVSERILNIHGQNCLFGVVLKFRQPVSTAGYNPQQQQAPPLPQHPPPFAQQQQSPAQHVPLHDSPYSQHGGPMMNCSHPQEPGGLQGSSKLPPHQGQQLQTGQVTNGTNLISTQSRHSQLANIAGLPGLLTPELIASLTALLPQHSQLSSSADINSAAPSVSGSLNVLSVNSSMAAGSAPMSRDPAVLGASPLQGDTRPIYQPPSQNNPPSAQGWPPTQSTRQDQQPVLGAFHSQGPDQGSVFPHAPSPAQQQQQPQQPQQQQQSYQMQENLPSHGSGVPSPASATLPGQGLPFSGPPQLQQGFMGVLGLNGQQFPPPPQITRPPQQPVGVRTQLPAEQLTQLTALLTQQQQQPAQQKASTQILQQHYQQQPSLSQPSPSSLPSHQHSQQSQQASTHQPQPLPLQQPQPYQAFTQHPQTPNYGQFSLPHWGQGLPLQPQTQQPPQFPSQPQSLPQLQQQHRTPSQFHVGSWDSGASQEGAAPDSSQAQEAGEPDGQKTRFQATLQLAAALLQQMQQQQEQSQVGAAQR